MPPDNSAADVVAADRCPVVAVTQHDLPGDGIGRLATVASISVAPRGAQRNSDWLIRFAADADVLVCANGDPVSEALLERCSRLRLVALCTAGYDSVDIQAAIRHGVRVTNARGVATEATADLAFALILAARRRVVQAARYAWEGNWTAPAFDAFLAQDVHSAVLGIVGYGGVGRAVAARAQGFRMTVHHHSRSRHSDALSTWMPLPELLHTSDVLSLHVPLTTQTRGLIGRRELRMMKPTATLVNTSRGGVVDEAALALALREGWIANSALDVRETEPPSTSADPLRGLENCIVVPHIGSATLPTRLAMADAAVENVLAHLGGRPLVSEVSAQGTSRAQ